MAESGTWSSFDDEDCEEVSSSHGARCDSISSCVLVLSLSAATLAATLAISTDFSPGPDGILASADPVGVGVGAYFFSFSTTFSSDASLRSTPMRFVEHPVTIKYGTT
jgi:hypothetical protein